jgi:NADPH:quinone reductase-like Zn-dependent oxidoreductase
MRAAVRTRYGPPEVVQIAEVDQPAPGNRELLVKVHATTVNRTDCGFRSGSPFFVRFFTGLRRPRRKVLGCEFAGEVEALGRGVTSFAVGDRVFGFSGARSGGHAEYLVIPEDGSLAVIPATVTDEQAAAGTEGSHYALSLVRHAGIRSGRRVLVNGATGAIGSAAVQLAKGLGAEVTGVCGAEQVELVRGLGADHVIDCTANDFTRDWRRYDVVIDAVAKSSFGRCRRLLKPGGIYLSSDLGAWAQNPLLAITTPLLGGRKVMFPIPRNDQEMIRYLRDLLESRAFRPLIDRRYPLDRIVEAYRYVETGRKIGNVVITVGPPAQADGPAHPRTPRGRR